MSRAYTEDEVIEIMVDKFRGISKYWAAVELGPEHKLTLGQELLFRCEGVAFSILAELDGTGLDFPSMDLVLSPHPDDKQYHKDKEENWFEPEMRISTTLHEHFHKKK